MTQQCSNCNGGPLKFCPFSLFLFASSAYTYYKLSFNKNKNKSESNKMTSQPVPNFQVVFVLGGPGAGKGTQCSLLTNKYQEWTHLSAGDLLRAERSSGSELAQLINSKITKGEIVPASITVNLLQNAMMEAYKNDESKTKFLIDGFPRSQDNVSVWNEQMSSTSTVDLVLFLECPEDVMTDRLLERGKSSGRNDDNLETIRKRFVTFREESMPIVQMYQNMNTGIVKKIVADKSVEEVFVEVDALISAL